MIDGFTEYQESLIKSTSHPHVLRTLSSKLPGKFGSLSTAALKERFRFAGSLERMQFVDRLVAIADQQCSAMFQVATSDTTGVRNVGDVVLNAR